MANPDNIEAVATETLVQAQKPPHKTQPHLPAIDGLRGLAAMGVVFVHCWCINGATPKPQFSFHDITVPLYRLFSPGFSGVFLFFILSGFCLTYPFLSNPGRPYNWPSYVLSRVRRILPAYIISFLILFLIGQWIYHAQILPSSEKFLYESFNPHRFIRELLLIQKSRIVNSYWTLVLEWRWYLLFPGLLLFARRFSPAVLVALSCGVSYLAQIPVLAGTVNQTTFDQVFAVLPMFALGIWAAHLAALAPERLHPWERQLISQTQLGVIAGALWCLAFFPPIMGAPLRPSVNTWGPLYFFLILAAIKHPVFTKILGSAPLAKLGVFSYSIYLLQEPIIRASNRFLHRPEHGIWQHLFTNFFVMPLLCILAGWAFYYVGERPFLKRSRK